MSRIILFIFLLFGTGFCQGQDSSHIHNPSQTLIKIPGQTKTQKQLQGFVKNVFGEILPFVNIHNISSHKTTQSDKNGFYTIALSKNAHNRIEFRLVGYESLILNFDIAAAGLDRYDILLKEHIRKLAEVTVHDQTGRSQNYTYLNPRLSTVLPSASGSFEALLKTYPGVSSNNELSAQYNVRGGNYDENLIYVNDIEIFRPFLSQQGQQEGLSFINPEMTAGIKFSTGGFGSEYGDKMSSVLDVSYRKPIDFSGSASIGFMGASLTVGASTRDRRFSYLIGFRQRSTRFLLKNLDTKGNYKPSFEDFQGDFHYKISSHSELSLLSYLAYNRYELDPTSRQTNFGLLSIPLRLDISFLGHELDRYLSSMTALTLNWQPEEKLKLKFLSSFYVADEQTTRDISGTYAFSQLQADPVTSLIIPGRIVKGIGVYTEHARDYLTMKVFTAEHKGSYAATGNYIKWGLRYQRQYINNAVDEYSLTDSAGYNVPMNMGDIRYLYSYQQNNNFITNRTSLFLQDNMFLNQSWSLTAGARATYLDISHQYLLSPRATLALHPNWKTDIMFRFSTGIYYQPPFYNEYFNFDGSLNKNLSAQEAIHYVASSDWHVHALGTNLVFFTELYYKQLLHLVPYEINDVSIRYLGNERSHGYATGLDMRLSGQFVKDLESSFSLSVQKTAEKIDGSSYSYIPRPTDQRLNFAIFFQDKLSTNPSYKVHVNLIYGSRLPIGPPEHLRYEDTLRVPAYRRVDIGFSKEWITPPQTPASKYIKSVMLYAEIFNLLNINNTISYLWVRDVENNRYAVPNYLTSRQLNLKLLVRF